VYFTVLGRFLSFSGRVFAAESFFFLFPREQGPPSFFFFLPLPAVAGPLTKRQGFFFFPTPAERAPSSAVFFFFFFCREMFFARTAGFISFFEALGTRMLPDFFLQVA